MMTKDSQLHELAALIAAEYAEMPGLCLTMRQAQRLWHIDRVTCLAAFRALTQQNIVRRNARGNYVRV